MQLLAWNKSNFGNVHRQLKDMREQHRAVKQGLISIPAIDVERRIMQAMDDLLAREEIMWCQRSRID